MITKALSRFLLLMLLVMTPLLVSASEPLGATPVMQDSSGNSIGNSNFSAAGGLSHSADGSLEAASFPPSDLSTADYQTIYVQAQALLDAGIQFRLCKLQLQNQQEQYPCPNDPNDPNDDPTLDQYYRNFNSGALLNQFCPAFAIDERGYCAEGDNIRNALMRARRLFTTLYLVRNEARTFVINTNANAEPVSIKLTGLEGMLTATRELAYAHMIFGSEYAIDAYDYAYTIEGLAGDEICQAQLARYQQNLTREFDPNDSYFTDGYFKDAECIINHELALLSQGLDQYEMALQVMVSSYHEDIAWPMALIIGQLFTPAELQIFAVAVENHTSIIDEMAIRHRQLGDDATAKKLYQETYDRLFLLTLPLLARISELYQSADANTQLLLNTNGLTVRAGLDLMTSRLQEMENGINVLGFTADYVPVQSYFHMRDASKELLDFAKGANEQALNATRDFEINADQLRQEMAQVRASYQSELVNLCGPAANNNDFTECVGSAGSLMEQSWLGLVSATLSMNLAHRRIDSAVQKIGDLQAQTTQVINIRLRTGEEIAATTLAQGMARAYQVTEATSSSVSDEVFQEQSTTIQTITRPGLFAGIPESLDDVVVGQPVDGVASETVTQIAGLGSTLGSIVGSIFGDSSVGSAIGGAATSLMNSMFGSTERTLIQNETKGKRHSETQLSSTNSVWNPSEIQVAELENVKAMALLVQDVEILSIERDFEIRNLLRLIAEMQIEKEQAAVQYNQAVSEHNRLVNRWLYLKAQYQRAKEDLHANYLANPAFRLLKDHKTEEASYLLLYVAKQAYLSAKALEYHMADSVPFINDVFKIRHPTHLQAYLHKLDRLNDIGEHINETNVEFSLRVFASGIQDQDITTAPATERQALIALRQARFQAFLNEHLIKNADGSPEKLVLVFDTSLSNRPINTPSRYNWRIAGAQTGTTDPSVDRCPVRKPYGVTVDILQGQQTLPNGMTVDLTMSGHTSTRQANGQVFHYSPHLVTLLPDKDLPPSIRKHLTEAIADASIDVNNPENTISDFCNMSVAAGAWILEIPLAENQIDFRLFQDIKLKMWTFYYS